MPITDLELVSLVLQKDDKAFEKILERYKDKAFSLLVGILKNKSIAEDALQDSFVKVYFALSTFKAQSSFSTWLYSIVYNTGITYAKRKNLFNKRHIAIEDGFEIEDKKSKSDFFENEKSKLLIELINLLPENFSSIIILFYMEELSLEEISKISGLTISNIKILLHRGRIQLKKIADKHKLTIEDF